MHVFWTVIGNPGWLRLLNLIIMAPVCRFWQKGYCKNGGNNSNGSFHFLSLIYCIDRCAFEHPAKFGQPVHSQNRFGVLDPRSQVPDNRGTGNFPQLLISNHYLSHGTFSSLLLFEWVQIGDSIELICITFAGVLLFWSFPLRSIVPSTSRSTESDVSASRIAPEWQVTVRWFLSKIVWNCWYRSLGINSIKAWLRATYPGTAQYGYCPPTVQEGMLQFNCSEVSPASRASRRWEFGTTNWPLSETSSKQFWKRRNWSAMPSSRCNPH